MGANAVVLGGSLAGLCAARALAERCEHVTVIERDELPEGPVDRAGLPQGRHIHAMLERGVYVIGFSYPVVPKGKARIRTQMSAAHSRQDLDRAIDAFAIAGRELGVIT